MPLLAGTYKPPGEPANFPDTFILQAQTGPGLLATTGDPVPDCTGTYQYAGVHNGEPYYKHQAAAFYLWYSGVADNWAISIAPGEVGPGDWHSDDGRFDTFEPTAPYTGNPVTASIPIVTIRLRIHGRRAGSGARRDYYPAGPTWNAGIKEMSPWQKTVRQMWSLLTRQYAKFKPFVPVDVTGTLTPNVTGWYGGMDHHNSRLHWYRMESEFHIWRDTDLNFWFLAYTFPVEPGDSNPYWARADSSPFGDYGPFQGAIGTATVTAIT